MKLYGLKLVNYVGIYNGMGLYDIFIDFSKCKHNITIIKGDNGSGKSTIFKAMNPLSDPLTSLIPGKAAKKIISYQMDDGDVITIQYDYPVNKDGKHVGTKCHIFKKSSGQDLIDLNPNGNVSEGRDMIYSLFDFDQNFMTLSQLSSEDRGLADKKPAERKKFINNIMDSLSAYNDIYKKLAKKSSALKTTINSINAKIGSIGNKDMIGNRIKTLEETLGSIEDRKALLLAELGAGKARLEAISNNKDIIKEVEQLKIDLYEAQQNIDPAYKYTNGDDELRTKYQYYTNEYEKAEIINNEYKDKVADINKRIFDLNDEIETKSIKLDYYGDQSNAESVKEEIDKLSNEIVTIENQINTGFDDVAKDISEYEYETASRIISNINMSLSSDLSNRNAAVKNLKEGISIDPTHHNEIIDKCNVEIAKLDLTIQHLEMLKKEQVAIVPKECNLKDSCPFAKKAIAASNADEQIAKEQDKIQILKKQISWSMERRGEEEELLKTMNILKGIIDTLHGNHGLFKKFGQNIDLTQDGGIWQVLEYGNSIPLRLDSYVELTNLITLKQSKTTLLGELKDHYSTISKNVDVIKILKEDIESLTNKRNILTNNPAFDEYDKAKNRVDDLKKKCKLIGYKLKQYELWKYADEISTSIDNLSKDYVASKEIQDKLVLIKDEIDDIMVNKYPSVKDEIEKLKYKLVLYNDYVEEYKKFSNKFNVIETVKKYASPSTGIQTVFMGMYMNDIITISNQLLTLLFNGEYVLHPFVINENEFRIPCSGKGLLNDDITSMSTSQICMISMIISFALLHKSSSVYNIIKLDEMDGGLDSQNRIQFILLLQRMMALLNAQQCVMISHNSELDMANADVIILRNSDPSLKINGNVIFQL